MGHAVLALGQTTTIMDGSVAIDAIFKYAARWSFEPIPTRDMRVILEARNLNDAEARLHTSFLKDQVPLPVRNFRAALVLDF